MDSEEVQCATGLAYTEKHWLSEVQQKCAKMLGQGWVTCAAAPAEPAPPPMHFLPFPSQKTLAWTGIPAQHSKPHTHHSGKVTAIEARLAEQLEQKSPRRPPRARRS